MKRHFLQLAQNFDPQKRSVMGWFMSEKLDGMRAFWDGGATRGLPANRVPWSNVEKDGRLIKESISTGLWSRYGKVIYAPDDFLDQLPDFPLDGELFAGLGNHQTVMSTVKRHNPGPEWNDIRYCVFDSPPMEIVLGDGPITDIQFKKTFKGCFNWYKSTHMAELPGPFLSFESGYRWLDRNLIGSRNLELVHQERLAFGTAATLARINERNDEVVNAGGEGLILRHYASPWTNTRSWDVLKVKTWQDDEAVVTGYVSGRETDKGSKLLGLMGALVTDYKGKRFELSGFTDEERELSPSPAAFDWCCENPGKDVPMQFYSRKFPIGLKVTFKYRELTDAGLPKEARYYRKYQEL